MTAARIAAIRTRAQRICDDSYTEHPGYSGRGMCGDEAPLAFTTHHAPGSYVGAKLRGLSPVMRVDALGCDYLYYLDTKID
jgi:hypothetical protein